MKYDRMQTVKALGNNYDFAKASYYENTQNCSFCLQMLGMVSNTGIVSLQYDVKINLAVGKLVTQ